MTTDIDTPRPTTYLDNKPACGAPKNWPWGYLECGCGNDGYGNHVRWNWTPPPLPVKQENNRD